jgi:hypothetical protein
MEFIIDNSGARPMCLNKTTYERLHESNFIDITSPTDEWMKFMDLESGKIHDCKKHYEWMMACRD